ncbi:MAG TPA: tagaturonate epimerase family protein, partial [Ktedonobacteraceae bacterium]
YVIKQCPLSPANALALREALPWLKPSPLGLETSAGFGDRLGLATPGHISALELALRQPGAQPIQPIFAQQSIREMTRTRRSPADVLNDATWGTFQAGWHGWVGADADHLKTTEDIDSCAAAGYTFYTFDPGAHVDSRADTLEAAEIQRLVEGLPWDTLESSPADLLQSYGEREIELESRVLHLSTADMLRAAAKYGRAIAHVTTLFRHLHAKGQPYEVEVSVDETETLTTHGEHFYIVSELRRLGVQWVSLAPRYVGSFEKGIDYIGDIKALRVDMAGHAEIARAMGPYKLSLHSGSDKFSIYPLAQELTRGLVHLKTAGTSYVEALHVIAQVAPTLFRAITAFAREHYLQDRQSYHVSAILERMPDLAALSDQELPPLLDHLDTRQVLHVTFGSTLDAFGPALRGVLQQYEQAYAEQLETHFYRHLAPFTQKA